MITKEQLRQEIEGVLKNNSRPEPDGYTLDHAAFVLYTDDRLIEGLADLIDKARKEAVDDFQDRLDEKEFTLGNDTTTPAIVYQWIQEVTDEMFPNSQ